MKSFSIKVVAIVLMATVASCSKDALRVADSLQQLDAVESVNDPFLLSSVIKQTARNSGCRAKKEQGEKPAGRNVTSFAHHGRWQARANSGVALVARWLG